MLKLLICIFAGLLIGAVLLNLRQQRLELNYQTNKLHDEIEKCQAKLWQQQLQVAVYTAPNAISKTVGEQDLKMVPQTPQATGHWIDQRTDAGANQ